MTEDLIEIKKQYVLETQEYLERITTLLFDLESSDQSKVKGILDEIYRNTHSMKHSSVSAGYAEISTIASQIETELITLGSTENGLDKTIVDTLFKYVNDIRTLLEYFSMKQSMESEYSGVSVTVETVE